MILELMDKIYEKCCEKTLGEWTVVEAGEPESISAAIEFVRRYCRTEYPGASEVLLAGSRAKGTASPSSDYDVVLIYDELPGGAWREMKLFEGKYIEIFSNDLETLLYLYENVDIPSGRPVLPSMIAEGISVISSDERLLRAAREITAEFLSKGPLKLSEDDLSYRRFSISNLAETLRNKLSRADRISVGAILYSSLADFFLRANQHWGASGKRLPAMILSINPKVAHDFEEAFTIFFSTGKADLVQDLIDNILFPYGGRLRESFRQNAPIHWRYGVHRLGQEKAVEASAKWSQGGAIVPGVE